MNTTGTTTQQGTPLTELEQKIEALVERYRASRYEDVEALIELTDLLPDSDGEPLETPWHFSSIALLKEVLAWHWRDREDFFVGGNMFVYYSLDRLLRPQFRGPDFFYVAGVDRRKHRDKWVFWTEESKSPDLIIEFLSPSTAKVDRTTKKDLYEKNWKTAEYFCYDPDLGELEGWRLEGGRYKEMAADERGWMWSEQLGLWLGKWSGEFHGLDAVWLRFYDAQGQRILLPAESEKERADRERKRAEVAEQRAETAEQELARLKARLAEIEQGRSEPGTTPEVG
jgi:Uma2 family endonuclease